jgi:hypothetical protein
VPPVAQPFPLFIPLQKLSGVPAEYSYCSIQLHVPMQQILVAIAKSDVIVHKDEGKSNRIRGL